MIPDTARPPPSRSTGGSAGAAPSPGIRPESPREAFVPEDTRPIPDPDGEIPPRESHEPDPGLGDTGPPSDATGSGNDATRPMRTPRRSRLGSFRLEEKIGEGGMGVVYRAQDPQLHRWVAIKRIHSRYEADTEYCRLFLGEARAVAAVSMRYCAENCSEASVASSGASGGSNSS